MQTTWRSGALDGADALTIPSGLAADLDLLTAALGLPDTNIATTLEALASDAATAVPSYVGLSVRIRTRDGEVELTTLDDASQIAGITTSLRIPLEAVTSAGADGTPLVLILYAAKAGAFVDLAADLAWLTGRPIDDVQLDWDLAGGILRSPAGSLRAQSAIEEAIGVLIGQGRTLDQARVELAGRAAKAGVLLPVAALAVLASISSPPATDGGPHLPGG